MSLTKTLTQSVGLALDSVLWTLNLDRSTDVPTASPFVPKYHVESSGSSYTDQPTLSFSLVVSLFLKTMKGTEIQLGKSNR